MLSSITANEGDPVENQSKPSIKESLTAILLILVGLTIGIDCAVNALYFLPVSSPYIISTVMASGFFLNYVLYRQDVDAMVRFFSSFTNTENDFSMVNVSASIFALVNGLVMFIFTYQSYAVFAGMVPALVPLVFCTAYGLGTVALLYDDCKKVCEELASPKTFSLINFIRPNTDVNTEAHGLTREEVGSIVIALIHTVCITYLSFYPAVSHVYAIFPSAVRASCDVLFASYLLTEFKYASKMVYGFYQDVMNGEDVPLNLKLMAFCNAFANGFMTLGESKFGLATRSVIFTAGAITSYGTMSHSCKDIFNKESGSSLGKLMGVDEIERHCDNLYQHVWSQ